MRLALGRCRLRQILRKRKLSQRWLADKADIPESQISEYVNDKTKMGFPIAATIARILGIHIEELYEWVIDERQGE